MDALPYTTTVRPDTGLTSPKLGIWLFLASEVMLFGSLFSAYALLRTGAQRALVDAHGGAAGLAEDCAAAFREWQRLRTIAAEASEQFARREAERAELEDQVALLDKLAPRAGEWEALAAEHRRLAHGSSLLAGAQSALEALSEAEGASLPQLAADQVVADDGTYLASWVGPELTPPDSAVALAREIMTRAVAMGYTGFAGFDLGLLPDGRALFFDLNFRVCGSTPTLLWYDEVRRRIGRGAWARGISISGNLAIAELCEIGRRLEGERCFLPTGGFDPSGTAWEGRMPHLRGVMMGRDRAETEARCEALLAQGLTFR